jgi:3-isopropylmalate dehydrogenase
MEEAANSIDAAVEKTLAEGYRTADIAQPGETPIGTTEMGDCVLTALA